MFGEKWGERKRILFKGGNKESFVSASYPESTHDAMGFSPPMSPHLTHLLPSVFARDRESPDKNEGQRRCEVPLPLSPDPHPSKTNVK